MSLPRISFLEGWERMPAAALLRGRADEPQSDTESDTYQDLPDDASIASSFPSTYSRLNFNPYAGPGWNESTIDDRDERRSLLGNFGFSSTGPPVARAESHRRQSSVLSGTESQKEPVAYPDTRGAFEVSPARRIAQVSFAVIYCFLAAGVVFGFAALKPVLIRENVYRHLCTPDELDQDAVVCDGQEIRLNLMFTIAAVVTNVSALPVGTILDAYGPRASGIIGSIFLATGAILFSLAKRLPFDGYIPGYLFLSLGGPFVFISSFQLSNTFPKRSGLILSMLTGAFDASSALFLLFRLLSEWTDGAVSTRLFFLLYLSVPLFILVVQPGVMPATSYKTTGELVQEAEAQVVDEINDRIDVDIEDRNESERQRYLRRERRQTIVGQIHDLLDDETASVISAAGINERIFNSPFRPSSPHSGQPRLAVRARSSKLQLQQALPQKPPNASGVWGVLHGRSAWEQLQTPWFVLITLFTILMMLRINYFVATLRSQYAYLLGSRAEAARINGIFDILLPVGGLVSIPFIGTFLDKFQTRTILTILAVTATAIGILGCIQHSQFAAYANIVLFVLYRPFYYTAVSDYAAKVFGFQTFGKVYGLIICLAGLGNFAQAGLDTITLKRFGGNPIPVNVILTVLVGLVGAALVAFVSWKTVVIRAESGKGLRDTGDTSTHVHGTNGPVIEGSEAVNQLATSNGERQPLLSGGSIEQRTYGS
ncbi:Protein FMP42 [Penicillium oxalicum]|uniref:Protein FMP42 n=1 Tax=Penicillium oxalicum TaxID=69781 RepID=UPI0020B75ADA|nr:Protein FMP42 [Penicillium oxalicum]KAI2791974.1 Protein FMP42 [Penicillium oxalicum]